MRKVGVRDAQISLEYGENFTMGTSVSRRKTAILILGLGSISGLPGYFLSLV